MRRNRVLVLVVAGFIAAGVGAGFAQVPGGPPKPAAVPRVDSALMAAQTWVGRALFVRGFPAANELRYDLAGVVEGPQKPVDWTLAGMDVQSVVRKGPQEIELDGVRVAIRYNPENRFFERHAQKDTRMKVLVATLSTDGTIVAVPGAFDRTLGAIFSVGIDPAMQRSMPEFWRHYFDPKLPWPADGLSGQTIYGMGAAGAAAPDQAIKVVQSAAPEFTAEATRDRVQGTVAIRLVVDATGVARRLTVVRPVGYGLDARAVEALEKTKFEAAQMKGTPVAATVNLTEDFKVVPGQP